MSNNENSSITRKALGRAAFLGALLRQSVYIANTVFECNFEENFKSKFEKLNVEAQLKISALLGLFALEGSGKYLCEEKSSEKSYKCSFIYQATTFEEQFNPFHDDLKDLNISFNLLDCTHVVTGIKWGANAILSVDYVDEDEQKK